MLKNIIWFNGLAFVFILLMLMTSFIEGAEEEPMPHLPQTVQGIQLKGYYDLAGEPVPMDNYDALERLDRELTVNAYWHSSTILNLKLAARFFPLIEPILMEEGVPLDFKYLAVAESGLRKVRSHAGASGYWQFRKTAAREMKLEVNGDIDERYNIELSTRAACGYLKQLHKRFGSWTLAAAAYNMGPTKLRSELKKQKQSSYYDLNFGEETSRYVFRIIALKEIMSSPSDFGFVVQSSDLYHEGNNSYTIEVDYQIDDLSKFAGEKGISYRELKILNPWMLSSRLPNKSRKLYRIRLPRK